MNKKIISIGRVFCLFCLLSLYSCDRKREEIKDTIPLSQVQKNRLAQSSLRADYKKVAEKLINDQTFKEFDKAYAQLNFDAANRTYNLANFDRKVLRKNKAKIKNNSDLIKAYKDAGMKGDIKSYLFNRVAFFKSRSDLTKKYPELLEMKTKDISALYFACTSHTFNHKKAK